MRERLENLLDIVMNMLLDFTVGAVVALLIITLISFIGRWI